MGDKDSHRVGSYRGLISENLGGMRKYVLGVGVLLLLLILTGCREQTDLYFYTNQKWKVESAITIDRAIMDLALGIGGMALGDELEISVPDSLLESDNWINLSLDWLVEDYRNQGLEASWRQRSNTYTVIVKGKRFAELPGVAQGLITLEQVPGTDDQYHLQMQALEMGEFDSELSTFGLGYERIVTLHAGKIIQGNTEEINSGIAVWRNPGLVDVVFVPASPFPWQIPITLLCAGGLIMTIPLAIRSFGGMPCPSCGHRVRKGQDICPNCGGDLSNQWEIFNREWRKS